jgi:CMP-N-acetylneuraminic acid synthetase
VNVVAFIPARAGSKRIPGKNLREVNGVSLLERAINSAIGIMPGDNMISVKTGVDYAVVSTDDDGAWNVAHDLAVERHTRPAALAADTARVEDAIAHWLDTVTDKPDVIVLLQPTSPLRTAAHVREALALMESTKAGTLVSVCVRSHLHFVGSVSAKMAWDPIRTMDMSRPRSQDASGLAHENGAIYVVTREHFERTGSLHGGHAVAYVMDALDSIDVDTPRDLYLAAIYESVRYQEAHGIDLAALARDGIDT